MPTYTVSWRVLVHGSCTVEAEDEDAATFLVNDTGEGADLSNIHEMLEQVTVTDVELFED